MKRNDLAVKESSEKLLAGLISQQALQTEINKQVYLSMIDAKKQIQIYVDKAINEIKQYIPLNDGEATRIKKAVSSRAAITTKAWIRNKFGSENYGGQEFFSKKYGHIVRTFWSMLKHEFEATKYTAILHADFEDAISYAYQLNIHSLPPQAKRITDNQLDTLNRWEKAKGFEPTRKDA
jgi:hypothetical protein